MIPLLLTLALSAAPAPSEKVPVILDTHIGNDVDQAFALALVLASPELELRAVTTVGAQAEDRAWMVCRFLTAVERKDIPVAWGRDPQPAGEIDWQIQYRRHPAALYNRTIKPAKESAIELMYAQLKAKPGTTILATGPLTNIARLLAEHPDCKPWIRRIVFAGCARHGGDRPAEANAKADVSALRAVLGSRVPLTIIPRDLAEELKLDGQNRKRLYGAGTMMTYQLEALHQLWDRPTPVLFAPLAAAIAAGGPVAELQQECIALDDDGSLLDVDGKPGEIDRLVARSVKSDEFLKRCTDRLIALAPAAPAKAPGNRSALVERGGMPAKVHAFEDFETDIEKRWWMCGKIETADAAPGRGRCCRGVLTLDFDDRQGDMKTNYAAVIFNPVPGPPMGPATRLAFRYKLHGTDTLRVQLYSLTKGYHRYLSLTGLPQDRWETAAVDMTAMRRPDGSGGPLAENERIDDIQFYTDPGAGLLIDDIVLYDAAPAGETRPFPDRILFAAGFDTGKQGKEWPGEFEIVDHAKPLIWKAAKSVVDPKTGLPVLRVGLRGRRPVTGPVQLRLKCRSAGGAVTVWLADAQTGQRCSAALKPAAEWGEATLEFRPPAGMRFADEIRFEIEKGAELFVDDLLLYQPG